MGFVGGIFLVMIIISIAIVFIDPPLEQIKLAGHGLPENCLKGYDTFTKSQKNVVET